MMMMMMMMMMMVLLIYTNIVPIAGLHHPLLTPFSFILHCMQGCRVARLARLKTPSSVAVNCDWLASLALNPLGRSGAENAGRMGKQPL